MDRDILYRSEKFIFSYRIAGVLVRDQKILLQKPANYDIYSLPGGHVRSGETSQEALMREFKEEINADINVEKLLFVGENFFPWGQLPCQQISLYYQISLRDATQIPLNGVFKVIDELENQQIELDFCWIPLSELKNIKLYPANLIDDLITIPDQIKHFVFKQPL
ncbi:NUDIX hydrolase [Acetobacterium sp.]|uniref:NUDIX hydrolase n=1 Tax=Acetobacterium sp. TaxID=1872094 RepID=UPI0035939BF7